MAFVKAPAFAFEAFTMAFKELIAFVAFAEGIASVPDSCIIGKET